ncbi:MAG: preprotein translocase subunit YajC [Litorimonas sp.]
MPISLILQSGATSPTGSAIASIIPFILIGVIFYFLLIRPQNTRLKKHRELLGSIVRGDTIVTNGGLIGKVKKVHDDELTVTFGGNDVKVVRTMIADVRGRSATIAANDKTKSDKSK